MSVEEGELWFVQSEGGCPVWTEKFDPGEYELDTTLDLTITLTSCSCMFHVSNGANSSSNTSTGDGLWDRISDSEKLAQ